MKLRFRKNSLRLRVNRREVEQLAAGLALEEEVLFPGEARMAYVLAPGAEPAPQATYCEGVIRVSAPQREMEAWAQSDSIGLYFELPAKGSTLQIAIEKDLECIDGPEAERDPDAFRRVATTC